jgi:glucose dehydrogenase
MSSNRYYDVVVVGAGVAGALIAYRLGLAGKRVALVESGPEAADRMDLVKHFALAETRGPGSPYMWTRNEQAPDPETHKDYYVFAGERTFKSTYERLVGGSTWHWLGNVPRLLPSDFRMRSLYGVGEDWPLTYDELEDWYCEAEAELGVSGNHEEWNGLQGAHRSAPFPMTEIWPSHGDLVVKRATQGLLVDGTKVRIVSTPQARNSRPYDGRPACAGNSSCIPICPIHAKYDASVHVEKAKRLKNVEHFSNCAVDRLSRDEAGRLLSVRANGRDGSEQELRGELFVLATHAIETARLLLHNKLATTSGQVGLNLMDHLNRFGCISSAEPVYPFRGPPTTSGIDTFRDGSFRTQRSAYRLSLGNDGWGRKESPDLRVRNLVKEGLFGARLRDQLREQLSRQLRISCSAEVLPRASNKVELDCSRKDKLEVGFPRISFGLDDYTRAGFRHSEQVMRQLFEAIGFQGKMDFDEDPNNYSGAGHILGTTRMGNSPQSSVVDAECRTHDHANLFVVGSSVFPTGGTANPTLTVAALSLRAARSILRQLEARPSISGPGVRA